MQGRRGRGSAAHALRDLIEISGTYERLVLDRVVTLIGLRLEFALLQGGIRGHSLVAIGAGELEHRQVQRVEAGQRDELELVAHCRKLALEAGNGRIVELALP